jgi:hypothetical protein
MRKTLIRLTEEDLHNVVKYAVKKLIKEVEGSESLGKISEEHYEIGFAYKFYTLWKVITTRYTTTYIYIKNISFSKDKAKMLYPDAIFNENLKGQTHTFTVSVGSGNNGGFERNLKPHKGAPPKGTPVELEEFLVQHAGIFYNKWNKPYYRLTGIDLKNPYECDFCINMFDDATDAPKKGDIIHAKGISSGFYDEKRDACFLNDVKYEYLERNSNRTNVEEGTKVKEKMIVNSNVCASVNRFGGVEKNGYLLLQNEDGEEFMIETEVGDFRTGRLSKKFETRDISIGDEYMVSGTVKKTNGLNRLLRAKIQLLAKAEDSEEPRRKIVKKVFMGVRVVQNKKELSSNIYRMDPSYLNNALEEVWKMREEHDGVVYVNECIAESVDDLKDRIERAIRSYDGLGNDDGTIQLYLWIPQTKENIYYNVKLIFEN